MDFLYHERMNHNEGYIGDYIAYLGEHLNDADFWGKDKAWILLDGIENFTKDQINKSLCELAKERKIEVVPSTATGSLHLPAYRGIR